MGTGKSSALGCFAWRRRTVIATLPLLAAFLDSELREPPFHTHQQPPILERILSRGRAKFPNSRTAGPAPKTIPLLSFSGPNSLRSAAIPWWNTVASMTQRATQTPRNFSCVFFERSEGRILPQISSRAIALQSFSPRGPPRHDYAALVPVVKKYAAPGHKAGTNASGKLSRDFAVRPRTNTIRPGSWHTRKWLPSPEPPPSAQQPCDSI